MIKTAIVGFGYSAQTFHLPFLKAHPDFELISVCSRRPEAVAQQLPGIATVSCLNQLLADECIALVVITLPNQLHYDAAKSCLEADKHVVLEKPMTASVDEAKALIELARMQNRLLTVFHNRRWDGDFLTVKALLQEERLGPLHYFSSHFDRFRPEVRNRWKEADEPGGGVWYDLGPHLVDQALQLFGPPETAEGSVRQLRPGSPGVDYFHVTLHYPNLEVVLQSSPYCAGPVPRFTLQSEKGCYRKWGLDPQEACLQKGILPGSGLWWESVCDLDGQVYSQEGIYDLPTQTGDYGVFFDGLARAIQQQAVLPVLPEESLQSLRLIEDLAAISK